MHWLRLDRYYSSDMNKDLANEQGIGAIEMYKLIEEPSNSENSRLHERLHQQSYVVTHLKEFLLFGQKKSPEKQQGGHNLIRSTII